MRDDAWIPDDTPVPASGPAGSTGSSGLSERGNGNGGVLSEIRVWLARFICTVDDSDLDLLALWAAHTHLCVETYTSPRLILDSPVPGSGKTTVLEHLERLCLHPVQMASLSSPALLTRMLDAGIRTCLIDEADRSLAADWDGVGELLAVLNSGYSPGPVGERQAQGWASWRVSIRLPLRTRAAVCPTGCGTSIAWTGGTARSNRRRTRSSSGNAARG